MTERYEAAAHAMQSGVAMEMAIEQSMETEKARYEKHLSDLLGAKITLG